MIPDADYELWADELKKKYRQGHYYYDEFLELLRRAAEHAYDKYKALVLRNKGWKEGIDRETEYQRHCGLINLHNEVDANKEDYIQFEKKDSLEEEVVHAVKTIENVLPLYENLMNRILIETEEKMAPEKKRGQNRRREKERKKKECYDLYDELIRTESKDSDALRKAKIAKKIGRSTKSVGRYLQER
jgi:hypothetical protein